MLYFSSRRKNTGFWWIAGVLIFILIILGVKPVRGFLQKLVLPIEFSLEKLSGDMKVWFDGWRPSEGLLEKNEKLKRENENLIVENARLKLFEDENKKLKQIVNFKEKNSYDLVVARVIEKVQELSGADKIYLIDRGKADGLKDGMPVITGVDNQTNGGEGGFLIGKIYKADEHWSQVLLITDYNSKVAALVIGSDRVLDCVVGGRHGLSLMADYLPVNEKIAVGDLVATSGLEALVPQGLIIGKVSEVATQPGDLFHKVDIAPLGRFDDARLLMVIKTHEF